MAEYDFIVTVATDLTLDEATQAVAGIEVPGAEIVSVQWVP